VRASSDSPRAGRTGAPVTAVLLTFNEAANVRRCLESVVDLCEVHVVDSGSTDETLAICRDFTDHVHHHPYANHAAQWQWALEHLPLATPWLLALDADFSLSGELRDRLARDLAGIDPEVDGIYVRHRYVFAGGPIRFGGTKRFWLRLVRRARARADPSDLVDFRFHVEGRTVRWDAAVTEHNANDDDPSAWTAKQDRFSLRLAVEEEQRRAGLIDWARRPSPFGNADERVMWLRDAWLRLPLFVRPAPYFAYRYLVCLGFLDGRAGFLYHFLQGFWLRVMVDWKIRELRALGLSRAELERFGRLMLETRTGSVTAVHARLRAGGPDGA